jgi:hypothetical protein
MNAKREKKKLMIVIFSIFFLGCDARGGWKKKKFLINFKKPSFKKSLSYGLEGKY